MEKVFFIDAVLSLLKAREDVAKFVGQDALASMQLARGAKENHARITSARHSSDGWRINLKVPIRQDSKKLRTLRLPAMNDEQAAGFLGVLGPPRAVWRKK